MRSCTVAHEAARPVKEQLGLVNVSVSETVAALATLGVPHVRLLSHAGHATTCSCGTTSTELQERAAAFRELIAHLWSGMRLPDTDVLLALAPLVPPRVWEVQHCCAHVSCVGNEAERQCLLRARSAFSTLGRALPPLAPLRAPGERTVAFPSLRTALSPLRSTWSRRSGALLLASADEAAAVRQRLGASAIRQIRSEGGIGTPDRGTATPLETGLSHAVPNARFALHAPRLRGSGEAAWPTDGTATLKELLAHYTLLRPPPSRSPLEWYEPHLRPHTHYAPLAADLSDLPSTIRHLRANATDAHRLHRAALMFVRGELSESCVRAYQAMVLRAYGARQPRSPVGAFCPSDCVEAPLLPAEGRAGLTGEASSAGAQSGVAQWARRWGDDWRRGAREWQVWLLWRLGLSQTPPAAVGRAGAGPVDMARVRQVVQDQQHPHQHAEAPGPGR